MLLVWTWEATNPADYDPWNVGPTGLVSLLLDAKDFILGPIDASIELDVAVHEAAASTREKLDSLFSILKNPEPPSDDPSPLEVPPLSIVEAMTEPYFTFIQPRMPIWTRRRFERHIAICQTTNDDDPEKRAALTCANNMVILTLATRLLKMTCLVAQLFLADDIFQHMFQQAVYLARLAGIEKMDVPSSTSLDSHEVEERNNILNCLHLIAPSVGWRGGTYLDMVSTPPPRSPSSESSTSSNDEDGIVPLVYLAQYELAVFTHAYSVKPYLPWPPAFAQPGSTLQRHMATWWHRYGDGFEIEQFIDSQAESGTMSSTSSMLLERALCYYNLRLLMTWQLPQSQQDSRQQITDSRITLRLLSLAIRSDSDLGHFASIIRDLELLQSFCQHVKAIADIVGEFKPHIFKLTLFTKTLTDLAPDPCYVWDKITPEHFPLDSALDRDSGQHNYGDQPASAVDFDEFRVLSSAELPNLDFSLNQPAQNSIDQCW
ncbi:hypothetical protein ONZ43_g1435 [Nemania bipapillata]|uniref:Uncharacterized protein n=1 Tax=Nemania bipapillata TaxID=110536 RepID=A0ACC2J4C9_9PEZI|nr:hypothetical protein ONZ43_g1435 [Nemania bipapillata]